MRIKLKDFFFWAAYSLLFLSLFIGDVVEIEILTSVSKIMRLMSYGLACLGVFFIIEDLKKDDIIIAFVLLALTVGYAYFTRDFYWTILVILLYISKTINYHKLFKISFIILLSGTLPVIVLCIFGVMPDVLTVRNTLARTQAYRHSLGFYHSNVLPLINLYLEVYYIMYKKRTDVCVISFFTISAFVLYLLCNSRNAFFLTILLSFLCVIDPYIKSRKFNQILNKAVRYAVMFISGFSFSMLFLINKGGLWDKVDTCFSGRFRLATFKMRRVGLHVINIMSNDDFFSDSLLYVTGNKIDTIVIDNGYLYVMLRYGIAAIVIYCIVSFKLSKILMGKNKKLYAVLIVFASNFIDNDLVDYMFLPFIITAFTKEIFDAFSVLSKYIKIRKKEKNELFKQYG